jgi:hypothetical protein
LRAIFVGDNKAREEYVLYSVSALSDLAVANSIAFIQTSGLIYGLSYDVLLVNLHSDATMKAWLNQPILLL